MVDGRMRIDRTRGDGTRSPSARAARCSTRAASASRGTATRSVLHGPRQRRRDRDAGIASRTTSRPSRRAMRAAGLPAGSPSGWRVGALTPAMIGGRRPLQGRKPGDRRVRVERPHAPYFRYTGPGPADGQGGGQRRRRRRPDGLRAGSAASSLGRPLASRRRSANGSRRSRPWRSSARTRSRRRPTRPRRSCGRSSSAARRCAPSVRDRGRDRDRGPARRRRDLSYRQICIAYPTGGGSYSVSKANFGRHRVAGRGVRAADRLQPDGRGLDVVGGRADHVGASRPWRRSRS